MAELGDLAELSKEIESALRDFTEALTESEKGNILNEIEQMSQKNFSSLKLSDLDNIKEFGAVEFKINDQINALEMILPNGDTMPLEEFNKKMFGETETPGEEGKSSASKPEPVEVLKTFFVEGQVPSDEALSAASEPYVKNWESRSEYIEIESSVRSEAQKVADTSDGRDAQKAGESGESTGTRLDDVTQKIEEEIDQNSTAANDIKTAKAELDRAYENLKNATTPQEVEQAKQDIETASGNLSDAVSNSSFEEVKDAKGIPWKTAVGAILAGGLSYNWYSNGKTRSNFESGCWLQYNGPSTQKPIRWKIANMSCDSDYITSYIAGLAANNYNTEDSKIIYAGVIDGSIMQGNLDNIYTGTFCGVDVNSKAAEDIKKAQQCWFNSACYKNTTDNDCLNGKTYLKVLFNPCLMDRGFRDASGISNWKSEISQDVDKACQKLFTDDVNNPELPDQQGCVNYKLDGENAVQLCKNSLTTSNCDKAREAGDLEDDIDVKKCSSKMFNLAPGFTIFHVYMSPIEGAATNTKETLNDLLDDFEDLLKSILKFFLNIGLPILGGILLIFILIKVVPSLLKKKRKQEITINVKGAQKFNYF